MLRCEAELCPFWTGDGCACAVFDIGPTARIEARAAMGLPEMDEDVEPDE